jgi:predicted TIM-barrel fold metal-dependent hydrolase
MTPITQVQAPTPANRLGLNYRQEVARLPWPASRMPIIDAHIHLHGPPDGPVRVFFEAADVFGISEVWSQTPLDEVDALQQVYGDRIKFVAVPDYNLARQGDDHLLNDWLRRIEAFAAKGARLVKFWSAPRGRDFSPTFRLDHPIRVAVMERARELGMSIMSHVADPDTWFATHYRDARRYGTKAEQYEPLDRLLDQFHDVPWLGAHMSGDPEHLDHLQDLLDRHPNFYIDTSATKWMVRELSKHPQEFRAFCRRNPGRVIFGADLVVGAHDELATVFDHYASRYWTLRTFFETDYEGPSPIVDPDLALIDPSQPPTATATLRGASFDPATLQMVYVTAAQRLWERMDARR